MKRILFLSTHNFATNPRLVKEIRLALENHFKVEVICFEFDNWSKRFNDQLIAELENAGVGIHLLQAGKIPFFSWMFSVVAESVSRLFTGMFPHSATIAGLATSRRSLLLRLSLKKIKKADWVIGHNPGALWPTMKAGKIFNCKTGFDVEDYHPGEGNDPKLQGTVRKLMKSVLKECSYVSFAAPLIREATKYDLNEEGKNWITVLNYFPGKEFSVPEPANGHLKIVWFSQNIDKGRGLEHVLPAIAKMAYPAELHLYGKLNTAFYDIYLKDVPNVKINEPIEQQALHKELSKFDIGLALESGSDRNRQLCITNKILAYFQAGLYIVASETLAQSAFIDQFAGNGICVDLNQPFEIENTFNDLINNEVKIKTSSENRYLLAGKQNWENESALILKQWTSN